MDDMDSTQAQIARTMLQSGDWVTARIDGVPYFEKAPLKYWLIAICYSIFGVHDWAARIPTALCAILLCWLTMRFARHFLGDDAGFYAGLSLANCVGMFLFTRCSRSRSPARSSPPCERRQWTSRGRAFGQSDSG
jgi:4-amino-4-deoxy-L-arabinose transferase-like glycosyltransferase